MSLKRRLNYLLSLSSILLPLSTFALSSEEITREVWFEKLKEMAPKVICDGFFDDTSLKQRMHDLKISRKQCMDLIPLSFEKCKSQYYSSIPQIITQDIAMKWGDTLGECIGMDFAAQYLLGGESTPNPMPALQSMPKDEWLKQMHDVAPAMICRGLLEDESIKKKMEEKHIDPVKCAQLIPESFKACQTRYYANLPNKVDVESTNKWGQKIGECIGIDFAQKYLIPENKMLPKTASTRKNASNE